MQCVSRRESTDSSRNWKGDSDVVVLFSWIYLVSFMLGRLMDEAVMMFNIEVKLELLTEG